MQKINKFICDCVLLFSKWGSQFSFENVPTPFSQSPKPNPSSFQHPSQTLKHVRQNSMPDMYGSASLNRRASDGDALLKTRKNVVGELDR